MKTSIYNKKEHLEGYVGDDKKAAEKSEVQKAYEHGNDSNEVTSFGRETIAKENATNLRNMPIKAKDGYDNTGTQGKDSLSDDSYHSADRHPTIESAASHTGSSSDDFKDIKPPVQQRDEDEVLNTGI
jgi:hypothetical protein